MPAGKIHDGYVDTSKKDNVYEVDSHEIKYLSFRYQEVCTKGQQSKKDDEHCQKADKLRYS